MKSPIQNLFPALAILAATFNSLGSSAHAQGSPATWAAPPSGYSSGWFSVACSADGSEFYAAGDGLFASTDSGLTWTVRNFSRGWAFVACSADGTKLVAGSGDFTPVYTSTDSGMTFTERDSSPPYVTSIASSADGTKLAVAPQDTYDIFTSTDSGVNWVDQAGSGPSKIFSSVASSSDGTKLVAVVHGGWIYTSVDSGVTWTPRDSPRTWTSVASSTNGTQLVAVDGAPGQIYTSSDSGTNWTARDTNRTWQAVASSADGTKLVAAVFNGQIYTSTDSGTNWTSGEINPDFEGGNTNIYRAWRAVASSADGSKLVAVEYPGGGTNGLIYISGTIIRPALNIFHNGNDLAITWPYPSTGWTLQQNSSLTAAGWSPSIGVTNNGHVNFIMTLPAGNKMFFRLQQQQ
jgi:photosystem II stability/assembly factor-like uncharacterized protein